MIFIINRNNAHPAHKAVGMPLGGQCRHVVLHYGATASSTFGREHVEVIVPTVRASFPLVESVFAELFAALGAEKMFRVPRFLQCRHAFLCTEKRKRSYYILCGGQAGFHRQCF